MKNLFENLGNLIGMEDKLLNVTNKLDEFCGYNVLDFNNAEDFIYNESIAVSDIEEGEEYNVEFIVVKKDDNYLNYRIKIVDVYAL